MAVSMLISQATYDKHVAYMDKLLTEEYENSYYEDSWLRAKFVIEGVHSGALVIRDPAILTVEGDQS